MIELSPARWSDGSPITARDVARSISRARRDSGFSRITDTQIVDRGRVLVAARTSLRGLRRSLSTRAWVLPGGRAGRVSGGPFRIRRSIPGLGLDLAGVDDWWGGEVIVKRFRVRYVERLEILIRLLQDGELDVAWPPSSVNLDERLVELGLKVDSVPGGESVHLRWYPGFPATSREALVSQVQWRTLEAGFVRDDGLLALATHRRTAPVQGTIFIGAPVGDELLTLLQRAIQYQLKDQPAEIQIAEFEARLLYGDATGSLPVQAALLRSGGRTAPSGGGVKLFEVDSLVAWRDGVLGPHANRWSDGPLWNVEEWGIGAQI